MNPYNFTENMTQQQLDKARRILQRDGWEYREDHAYPVSDNRRMGWWVNTCGGDEYNEYRRPLGDPKPYRHATENTYRLYSGHDHEELR